MRLDIRPRVPMACADIGEEHQPSADNHRRENQDPYQSNIHTQKLGQTGADAT
jgi:hypothetical protein